MIPRNGPPLTKLFLSYLAIEKGLSQNTIDNYANDLARLTHYAYQTHKPIEQLRARELRQFITQLHRERLSPATIRRVASTLRGLYAFLALDDYLVSPPTDDLNTPPPVSYRPTFLTETQIHALFEIPDLTSTEGLRDRAIVELMYAAGLRVTEVLSLLHKHIDLRNGVLTCVGKGRKERTIPFGRSAALAIENYVGAKPFPLKTPNSHLFLNNQKPLSRQFLWTLISRYGAAASIGPISPHTLRHTFATHLLQHGAQLKYVQALLGHADISTTVIYTHITPTYLRRSYNKHHPRAN
jgi:integrase/recombinase XerD